MWESSCPLDLSEETLCCPECHPLVVLAKGQEGAGSDRAEEGAGGGDTIPRGPGPGDEAETHAGSGGAHGAAGAVQEGALRGS